MKKIVTNYFETYQQDVEIKTGEVWNKRLNYNFLCGGFFGIFFALFVLTKGWGKFNQE